MSTPRYIFSYFVSLPDMDMANERILVSLWAERWRSFGFTPIVLNEFWARKHPAFDIVNEAIEKLPSINPAGYDRQCYLRWLACEVAAKEYTNGDGLIVMADYDVFPYLPAPNKRFDAWFEDLVFGVWFTPKGKHTRYRMLCLHGNCPALVIGMPENFADMSRAFVDYELTEKDKANAHISDQYIFEAQIMKHPKKFKVSMDVVLYSDKGWETAPAVHFSNSVMAPDKTPKHKWIPLLRS